MRPSRHPIGLLCWGILGLALVGRAPVSAAPAQGSPTLAGTWAMEGTGPADFVASGGRIATLLVRQQGHALTITVHSGSQGYSATGRVYFPQPRVTFRWYMKSAGLVHFDGALQRGGMRILGAWSDNHGDDGGALLVRVAR